MDGANTDSDHSMTWEDFFGSTTDLAPTLLDIYDSLLEPTKAMRPEVSKFDLTARDNRNNPPLEDKGVIEPKDEEIKEERNLIVNKSSLHTITAKINAEKGANNDVNSNLSNNSSTLKRTYQKQPKDNDDNHLSPNVRRLISGMDTNSIASKKMGVTATIGRTSLRGHRSNIPLIGATSKISQSGVNILPSVEIYDRPIVSPKKTNKNLEPREESPSKTVLIKPDFKIGDKLTNEYDVPKNIRPVTLTPDNKTAFESLSLPYIDSSIDVSTAEDREFDVKLSSRDKKAQSTPEKHSKFINGSQSIDSKEKTTNAVENLKPEKEVPKLNPPILEVSRPLSMSSIASSSSSSSGAQNKGVNSAYLASIESLDDHSDADVSGNGSNHFLNKAGLLNSSISEERNMDMSNDTEDISELSQLERVCEEIVQTENVYVQGLQEVVEGYLNVWRRESTFSSEELSELFNNIEEIYAFNRSLCEELNTCRLDATCIAKCFVNNTSGFTIYTSYCTGYPRTMERLAALASTPHTAREFRERQVALGHPLPLASYLLKPVQRILKYHLLLQNLVKQCASPETEYALLKMTGIAHHIDDMKRKHEHAVRVQEIQSLLYGWNGPDLTTYGELCAEGTFRVFGAKAMRHVFLFDKMLLVTKNREDNVLAYKSHIMCNNMMLVECISGAPLSFHVIPWDSPRSQLTLQARSHRHKREWTLLLKRVILENYNAVIPSHARQLVMELGQNRTDDDILAEKSHRLITQPSMRKQLSAPEYLEKRKLERERRKHFDASRGRKKDTLSPTRADDNQDCDCIQVSIEKGIDYTCENCYIDLCSDCEITVSKNKKTDKCICNNKFNDDDCPECEKDLQFIDSNIEQDRKMSTCKCAFESSQENVTNLSKTRGYHSSDSIAGFDSKVKDNLNETNSSLTDIKNIPKICIQCTNIKENVVANDMPAATIPRKSRINIITKNESDKLRSKSRDDPQRSKGTKLRTWRRKSEPGLQNNTLPKKVTDNDNEQQEPKGNEKIEFECRNCGSNRISKKIRSNDVLTSDNEEKKKFSKIDGIKMYDTKRVPKKISKLKKTRAKTLRLGADTTAKFYADFPNDMPAENILHISESNDSLHDSSQNNQTLTVPQDVSKDADIDDETYKKLIEKTDSFKKNELEKVKFLNNQKVISESVETEDKTKDNAESSEETEKPLEEIISQLLMQNREFQKILKKQQLRNSAQRRHQRLLKSHSNPEAPKTETTQRKFVRQASENLDLPTKDAADANQDVPSTSQDYSDDEHIYETLRVETKTDIAAKLNQSNSRPSSLKMNNRHSNRDGYKRTPESDYVYLSVNKLNDSRQNIEGIYDVPIISPEKATNKSTRDDYYVIVEPKKKNFLKNNEDHYDSVIEVERRKKNEEFTSPSEYLPMNKIAQSPVTPEIWLSRQKEHFNVPRDRKSGSLPRSFQVISTQEEESLTSFKSKRNSNGKMFLNKDGKVMSIDRPFTIALDKGELNYDDVENYMNEQDMMKFNKISKTENDQQEISKSTLALEEEIDQCYKNNFESLSPNKAESILNVSAQKLNTSTTSSCEALPSERNEEQIIHPEHKIYKPNNNILSLKNVLNRFKTKNVNKSTENDGNASESSPEIGKEIKSQFSEKRSGLNPRSYSKNLLHRFRSIIGDEQESGVTKAKDEVGNKRYKNTIKVIITTSDAGSVTSISDSDPLSKSMYGTTTLTDSQNENSKLELVSQSCENINKPLRPTFDKSISLVTNASTSAGSSYSQKSSTSSYQSLNKLPIYMQGSKNLGARIAQSDYVDPSKLATDKSNQNEVNVLINKNSLRPDSLISSSSFVTSSSGGGVETQKEELVKEKEKFFTSSQGTSDESYYEKSFERIESIKDDDVCRDSAVYSDQEDTEVSRTQNIKTVTNTDEISKETSISTQRIITRNSIELKTSSQSRVIATCSNINQIERVNFNNNQRTQESKPRNAPPLPLKPKLTNIPSKIATKSHSTRINSPDLSNTKPHSKPNFVKSVSVVTKDNIVRPNSIERGKDSTDSKSQETKVTPSNIHLKRLNFERASLDSALRKTTRAPLPTKSSTDASTNSKATTKSVQERRLEIESMHKAQNPKTNITKNSNASKFGSHIDTQVNRVSIDNINNKEGNNSINENNKVPDELKGSWVKTVVNKFQ